MPTTIPIAEAVTNLTADEAKILAYYATPGQGYDDVAKETGASKDEVVRVVEKIANNNRPYARTLALEWQRINGTGRIGTATTTPTPATAPKAPVEPVQPADTIADLLNRATATEVPRLVRLADKAQDLLDQLEAQVADYEKGQALREEAARLELRLAAIKQELTPKRTIAAPAGPATSGTDAKTVRAWAVANGIDVPKLGRIPAAVMTAYENRAVRS
jgi:hypothetical protein